MYHNISNILYFNDNLIWNYLLHSKEVKKNIKIIILLCLGGFFRKCVQKLLFIKYFGHKFEDSVF